MRNTVFRYCVVFSMLLFCFSCSLHKEKFSYPHQYKNEKQSWIDAYKYNAFWGCVNAGLGNDSLRLILKRKDLYYPYSEITFHYVDEARDKGRGIIEKLPLPYIKIDIGDEEFYEGKNYISLTCLNYYESRDLEKTAQKAYKEFIKQRKKEESEL